MMKDGEMGAAGACLWAMATIACFGSQTVHLKLRVCRRAKAPWHLKLFFSLGAFLVGILTALYVGVATDDSPFNKWGAFTAFIWAPGTVCMLAATDRIGVGLTIGLIAAVSSIVSCATGALLLGDPMPHPLDAALAMALLVAGIAVLASSAIVGRQRRVAARRPGSVSTAMQSTFLEGGTTEIEAVIKDKSDMSLPNQGASSVSVDKENAQEMPDLSEPTDNALALSPFTETPADDDDNDGHTQVIGGSCAVITGVLYGCQGITITHGEANPLGTGASMMLTQLPLMALIVLLGLSTMDVEKGQSRWRPQGKLRLQSVLFSLFGGALFGVGFVGQNFVVAYFGAAVGVPLTQSNLVVAGLWGICAFREVQGVDLIGLFAVGSALVLGGVVLLAVLK